MRDALLSRRALLALALLAIVTLALSWRSGENAANQSAPLALEAAAPDASASPAPALQHRATELDGASNELPLPSEPELMRAAHLVLETDPERALALIESADQRFGEEHEERRVLEIEALVRLQRIGLSHARAAAFYRRFPRSAYGADVERLTGYHPRPRGHE